MKSIKNIREFAEANGISRQVVENRINRGWVIGIVNGKKCMFNPANVHEVKEDKDEN